MTIQTLISLSFVNGEISMYTIRKCIEYLKYNQPVQFCCKREKWKECEIVKSLQAMLCFAMLLHKFDVIGNSLSFRQISAAPLPRLESNKNMREIIQRHLFPNAFNQTMDICLRLLLNFPLGTIWSANLWPNLLKRGQNPFQLSALLLRIYLLYYLSLYLPPYLPILASMLLDFKFER